VFGFFREGEFFAVQIPPQGFDSGNAFRRYCITVFVHGALQRHDSLNARNRSALELFCYEITEVPHAYVRTASRRRARKSIDFIIHTSIFAVPCTRICLTLDGEHGLFQRGVGWS
jgi:hypothetical protein